jgi:hypothetical protein
VNCLDAETLAAWFDGALSGAALEDVRLHVADCARCQALVGAMGQTRAAAPVLPKLERSPRWWLAWAVPAAAAATAVAIWVAVPRPTNVDVNPSSSVSLQKQEAQPPRTPPAAPAQAEPAAPASPPATLARPTTQARAKAAEAAAPPAAPVSADAAQQAAGNLADTLSAAPAPPAERREAVQPQGAIAGQPQARALFATNFCGPMWPQPPADVASQIAAGSAPSGDVCWMVGRAGTVLLSTDHQTWQRVNIPEAVDLSRITATDARTATVVAADGRTFSTADGGVTWMLR